MFLKPWSIYGHTTEEKTKTHMFRHPPSISSLEAVHPVRGRLVCANENWAVKVQQLFQVVQLIAIHIGFHFCDKYDPVQVRCTKQEHH